MSAEQRQQTPLGAIDLGVGATLVRRLERLGEVEGKVDRHQRVEREREEAEPRGPDPAIATVSLAFGRAGVGSWCGTILAER